MVRIYKAGKDRLDTLEPLWRALQEHHAKIGAVLGALRSPEESWTRRRREYEQWFDEPGTFMLIAEIENRPVGYALVHHRRPSCAYATSDQPADLATLSVLPEFRGQKVGEALMKEVFLVLQDQGVTELSIGVVSTNNRAIRFYRRMGFHQRYVTMWGSVPPDTDPSS